ncbi:hypothetical protein HDU96_002649 [Phlyctochytrium bullatum]|nr:hypothetical protein HDU96_002649 [Phlyctochytrium bullatum]
MSGYHGRTKGTAAEKDAEKIKTYCDLNASVLSRRKNGTLDEESLEIVTRLLMLNPEHYTAWNYRRELIQEAWKKMCVCLPPTRHWSVKLSSYVRSEEEVQANAVSELKFVEKRIREHPKSYWLEVTKPVHGWDYRRCVNSMLGWKDVPGEIEYTKKKIFQNFSNFSAWHYRSKLLKKLGSDETKKAKDSDLEMVRNAIFTEPADQSAWLYQRWLLDDDDQVQNDEVWNTEAEYIEELLTEEPDSKWALLTLVYIYTHLGKNEEKALEILEKLKSLDKLRTGYYEDLGA